ncbi:hypothetical protein Cni_G01880 [Canna indica]|uniref:Reverse transcriptase zinc-binding domain-containing protein n=1 Tax=Canna indica TaxID=4628 RepID=A0AAQ3JNP3_9LILI|nr:hypothetical protein Cni_G01880 [Canna indica]
MDDCFTYTTRYIISFLSGNKAKEPDVAEFASALAAASVARLMVEDFIEQLLPAHDFPNLWISGISQLLRCASSSLLINGAPGRPFQHKRGIRQGNPLSPLLFSLIVDSLSRLIGNAAQNAFFRGALNNLTSGALGLGSSDLSRLSHVWKGILSLLEIFKASTVISVGSGHWISPWRNRWSSINSLHDKYPTLYALTTSQATCIADAKLFNPSSEVTGWDISFSNYVPLTDVLALANTLEEILHNFGNGSITWKWSSFGVFSTSSLYKLLNFRGLTDYRAIYIWQRDCPISISMFNWFYFRKRPHTKDHLIARGMNIDSACHLCGLDSRV